MINIGFLWCIWLYRKCIIKIYSIYQLMYMRGIIEKWFKNQLFQYIILFLSYFYINIENFRELMIWRNLVFLLIFILLFNNIFCFLIQLKKEDTAEKSGEKVDFRKIAKKSILVLSICLLLDFFCVHFKISFLLL